MGLNAVKPGQVRASVIIAEHRLRSKLLPVPFARIGESVPAKLSYLGQSPIVGPTQLLAGRGSLPCPRL